MASLSPLPEPYFTPAPGDADLPVIPGTTILVVGAAVADSSNHAVLAPLPAPSGETQRPIGFRALAPGCATLRIGTTVRVVAVRSPVSRAPMIHAEA